MGRGLGILIACLLGGVAEADTLPVLAYHDLVKEPSGDEYAVTAKQFREQLEYLNRSGYQPIRLRDYVEIAHGRAKAPPRAVMLTFDDGLTSFRDVALPLLEEYRMPAILSVVTGWLDGTDIPENYRGRLLSAAQLRELSRSPWVEIISHSHRLHEGISADPHGSRAPAGVTRRYLGNDGYESESTYRNRVRADLRTSVERLTTITGQPPRGIAWPYGLENSILAEEAAGLGLEARLALDDRRASSDEYPRIARRLLRKIRSRSDFEALLRPEQADPPRRIVEIRLDGIAALPFADQDRQLRQLAGRIQLLRANLVIVHAFSRDGRTAHFANAQLPVQSDILHRALYLLRHTAAVRELVLALPDRLPAGAVHAELARRHPFDGIVVTGSVALEALDALRRPFEAIHPGMRCGTEAPLSSARCSDFRLIIGTGPNLVEDASGPDFPAVSAYYLVRREAGTGADGLLAALRQLRRAGVRHYGAAGEGLLDDPAVLRRVAVEYAQAARIRPGG